MRNAERNRDIRFGILAALPLLISWTYKFAVLRRPFWIYYYDAEATSFFQALRISLGEHPTYIDHPGTPVQLIGAAIAAVGGLTAVDIEPFLGAAYVVVLIVGVGAIAFLRATLFRGTNRWLWVTGVWTFWLAPSALEYDTVWVAEALFFPLGVLALAAIWRVRNDARSVALAGLAVGACVGLKFTFASWAVALVIMIITEPWTLRRRIVCALLAGVSAIGGFVAVTSVAFPEYGRMLQWIGRLAAHRGAYGTGMSGMPVLSRLVFSLVATAWQAKWWLVWIAVLVTVIILKRVPLDRSLRFVLPAGIVSLILGLRAPSSDFRYYLPMAVVAIFAVAELAPFLMDRHARGLAVIAAVLMIGAISEDLWRYTRLVRQETRLRMDIDAAVDRYAPGGVVVYTWRAPEPSLALRSMTEEPRFRDAIAAKYPKRGHWVPWNEGVQLPHGARTWDVVVLNERWLNEFPEPLGRTATIIPPYCIILHPGAAPR